MNNAERIANDMAARRAAAKTKHTPEPWKYDPGSVGVWAENPYGHGLMRIADVRGWGHLTGRASCAMTKLDAARIQDATGVLLAAAPDLLAALEGMIESYDLAYQNSPEIVQDSTLRGYFDIDAARAALAKAKGE